MYAYRISYLKMVKHLGWVACSFRTTADAVELHKSALAIQRHAGQVCEVVVEALGA
jgi:hypothetical protein